VSCNSNKKDIAIEQKNAEREKRIQNIKTYLLSKYNAVEFKFNDNNAVYTYTIQKWLDNNSVIVFNGYIEDIFLDSGKTTVVFGCPIGSFLSKNHIYFILDSEGEGAKYLLDNPPLQFVYDQVNLLRPNYYVVCRVNRIVLSPDIQNSGGRFAVKGKMIDYIDSNRKLPKP
jgi:hypothetical protein